MKAPASMITHPGASRENGYATLAVVSAVSLIIISMLTFSLLGNINNFDVQARAQVKQDYTQKEDAILSALLQIVPNKAIGAMQRNSADSPDDYSWEAIFEEALALANAEQAAEPQLLNSLDLSDAISANTGDTTLDDVFDVVEAPVRTYAGGDNLVNGGNWWEFYMLGNARVGPHVPAPLRVDFSEYRLDMRYPIISYEKTYVHWYTKGLSLSPNRYPLYNLIQYPDVEFGYKKPGELFVAKRNWWVFTLKFGAQDQQSSGVPVVKKDYVISIYEIPSQLPLASNTRMQVGRFADGTNWSNVDLAGGIYANEVETQGSVSISDGSISARESVDVNGATTVDGEAINANFNDMGQKEARALQSDSDYYAASVSGNVGTVAFIPINRGTEFLERESDGPSSQRISPTGWNDYSRGANQAAMRLEIREMLDEDTQIPTSIRLHYEDQNGNDRSEDYTRGDNWPAPQQPGGDEFPFQTDELENLRNALIVYLDRLPEFVDDELPDAADIDTNHSLYIYPNASQPTVSEPSIPSEDDDLAISLRQGKDMTPYTSGFSLVSNLRVYIAETLNSVSTSPPPHSGIDADEEYYPPLSIFAPEKRFGESLVVDHPVSLRGQLSSLKSGSGDTFNPLELKGADDDRVDADRLSADLVNLRSPADLPPIHQMNWLVTIEEIHSARRSTDPTNGSGG